MALCRFDGGTEIMSDSLVARQYCLDGGIQNESKYNLGVVWSSKAVA